MVHIDATDAPLSQGDGAPTAGEKRCQFTQARLVTDERQTPPPFQSREP
jgi:hypothetical protein